MFGIGEDSTGAAMFHNAAFVNYIKAVGEFRVIHWGSGFDVDQAGNLIVAHNYSPTRGSLRIYGPDLNVIESIDKRLEQIPKRVDLETGDIECRDQWIYRIHVFFDGSKIRRV